MPNININRRIILPSRTTLTPPPVSGAKVWLRANGLVTGATTSYGTVDGSGEVTQWTDLTGNGNHATYVGGTGTSPNLTGTVGTNTKNGITFDGVLDNLQITNLALCKNVSGITIFVIFKTIAAVGGVTENELVFIGTDNASRGRLSITYDSTSGRYRTRSRRVDADDTSHQLLGNVVNTNSNVLCSSINFSTGYGFFTENGSVINWDTDTNSTTGNCGNTNSAQISIGNLIHATNYPSNAVIAEVLIYDTPLTVSQVASVNEYYQSYYGIASASNYATQAETTTYLNRLTALGYTAPSSTWITHFNNLIAKQVANANGFSKVDRWGLFETETENPALVDIKDTTKSLTLTSTTWDTKGFIGNGTTSFINTNLNLSTGTTNYTQNSAMLLAYGRKTAVHAGVIMGAKAASDLAKLYPRFTDGKIYGGVNNATGTTASATNFSAFNITGTRRALSTTEAVFWGNELETASARNSTGRPAVNLYLLAHNNNGTAAEFYAGQISTYIVAAATFDRDAFLVDYKTFEAAIGITS